MANFRFLSFINHQNYTVSIRTNVLLCKYAEGSSDSWLNEIRADLPEGEECIKQAEACKCLMEARAVFHHSYNKSDKRGDGNNPDWGQMITVVLSGVSAAACSLARPCVGLIIERGSISAWETPHQ